MLAPLSHRTAIALIFVAGLAISLVMVARSQVAGDQLNLLALGWMLVEEGEWIPFGNPTTGGGKTPGGVTALLVGLPLLLWRDHRAATLLVLLTHLAAYWILDRLLRRMLEPEERLVFALLYWLSPWRLFYSGFLWNPNYLFLFGALHLWTAHRLRRRALFWPTFLHVVAVGLALQIEVVALPLAATTPLLWWRGYLRLHRGAVAAGAATVALTLAPWAMAILEDPGLVPRTEGFIGKGLLLVYPLYRGILYLLRFSSLALDQAMFCLDLSPWIGDAAMERFAPALDLLEKSIYVASLLLPLWTWIVFWRRSRGLWLGRAEPDAPDRAWLAGVIRLSFLAAALTFALSPTNIMRWYGLGLFHLAVLVPVLALGPALRGAPPRRARAAFRAQVVLACVLAVALAFASPPYRCGGDRCDLNAFTLRPLRSDHPMLRQLGVSATCPLIVDDPEGWWPEVLPPPTDPAISFQLSALPPRSTRGSTATDPAHELMEQPRAGINPPYDKKTLPIRP